MTLEHRSEESERLYSPEEAGEILKRAAHQQDGSFTLEQLQTIAREAGISDEHLSRAISQYHREQLARQQKRRARKGLIGVGLSILVPAVIIGACLLWVTTPHDKATTPEVFTTPAAPPENLMSQEMITLASARSCVVYKAFKRENLYSGYEEVYIQREGRQPFKLGNRFQNVTTASISLTGDHVALYDKATGEIWVANTQGEGLHCVARIGEIRGGEIISYESNPIAGWSVHSHKDCLRARTKRGGYIYIFIEP